MDSRLPRPGVLVLLVLLLGAALVLAATRFLGGDDTGAPTRAGAELLALPEDDGAAEPAADPTRASRSGRSVPANLGTVRGVLTLDGPDAPEASRVRFTLAGPAKISRTDEDAPFRLRLDTRELPDGSYTVTIRTWEGSTPTLTTSKLKIRNGSASKATGSGKSAAAKKTPSEGGTAARKTATPTPTRSKKPSPPPADESIVGAVVRLTNAQRDDAGCDPLRADRTLNKVAQAHSVDMAEQDYFAHDSKDGRTAFERMSDAGYEYSTAAENIAAGQRTAQSVVEGWMNSPGHRANILNCRLKEIGIGYAEGGSFGTYWTQDFGTPR